MSDKPKNVKAFTIFKKEKENGVVLYMKPNLGKFGVQDITVTLNDGSKVELSKETVFFLNDTADSVRHLASIGKIEESEVEGRLAKLAEVGVSKDVNLKL